MWRGIPIAESIQVEELCQSLGRDLGRGLFGEYGTLEQLVASYSAEGYLVQVQSPVSDGEYLLLPGPLAMAEGLLLRVYRTWQHLIQNNE